MKKHSLQTIIRFASVGFVVMILVRVANANGNEPQFDESVPEIAAASMASAVALLSFGAMLLGRRFRSQR